MRFIKTRAKDEKNDEQVHRNDDDSDDDSDDEQSNSTNNINNSIESENTRSDHIRRDDTLNNTTFMNENEELYENNCFEDYKSDIEALLEHIVVVGNEKRFWYGRVKKAGSYKIPFLFYHPNDDDDDDKKKRYKIKSNPEHITAQGEENARNDVIWIREYVMEQLQLYQKDQKYRSSTKNYMKSLALMITNGIIRAQSILCNERNNILNDLQNMNISTIIQSYFLQYSHNILKMEKERKFATTGISSQKQQGNQEFQVKEEDDDNRKLLDDDMDDVKVAAIEMSRKQEKSMDQDKKIVQQTNLQRPNIVSNYDELFVDIQTKAFIHVYHRIMLEKSKHKEDVAVDKIYDNEGATIANDSSSNVDNNNYLINDQKRNLEQNKNVLIHSSDIGLYEESVNVGFEQLPWPIPRKRKNMFGDGYRYRHTYTDDIDMNINPITFSKDFLSLLPSQQQITNDNNHVNLNNFGVSKKRYYSDTNPAKEQQVDVDDDPHLIEKKDPNRGLLLHCWQRALHAASSSINVSVSSSSKTIITTDSPEESNTQHFQRNNQIVQEKNLTSNDNTNNRSNPSDNEQNITLPHNMEFISHYEKMKSDVSYSQLICQRLGLTLHSFFQKSCDDDSNKNVDNDDGIQHDNDDDDSSVIFLSVKRRKTNRSSSQKQNTEEENDGKPFSDRTLKLQQVKDITPTRKYACPACSIEFHSQSKLHNHYYGMNQTTDTNTSTATEADSNDDDIRTTSIVIGCCWTLIEQTRCKQIEGLLQREVDVQLKQLLQLIFVNTLVTQSENNNQEDCNQQSITNSTTEHMKTNKKKSSSSTTQNTTSNSNSSKKLYNWKHIISMLERALHESKVGGSSNENNKKSMNNNDDDKMNEKECFVNNKKTTTTTTTTTTDQQQQQQQQQRHPLFETLSFFSNESPLVLNPMILQTIKNRLVDRYCTVPR